MDGDSLDHGDKSLAHGGGDEVVGGNVGGGFRVQAARAGRIICASSVKSRGTID